MLGKKQPDDGQRRDGACIAYMKGILLRPSVWTLMRGHLPTTWLIVPIDSSLDIPSIRSEHISAQCVPHLDHDSLIPF